MDNIYILTEQKTINSSISYYYKYEADARLHQNDLFLKNPKIPTSLQIVNLKEEYNGIGEKF